MITSRALNAFLSRLLTFADRSHRISTAGFLTIKRAVSLLGLLLLACQSLAQHSWKQVNPDLHDVLFADGRFYAVGTGGTILSSTNGRQWRSQSMGIGSYSFRKLAFAKDRLAALPSYLPYERGGGVFSCGSVGGEWRFDQISSHGDVTHLLFAHGRHIAVLGWGGWDGTQGVSVTQIFWSDDYAVWHQVLPPLPANTTISAMASNGNATVAVGSGIWSSFDGMSWTAVSLQGHPTMALNMVCANNGRFIAVGDLGLILQSADGFSWETATTVSNHDFVDIAPGMNGYVAITGRAILHSPDLALWSEVAFSPGGDLCALAYGNGTYVAVTDRGVILASDDGVHWDAADRSPGPKVLDSLLYSDGLFVAFGKTSETASTTTGFTSSDGDAWIARSLNITNRVWSIASGRGVLIGVGDGGVVLRSTDAQKWDVVTNANATTTLRSVAYHDGSFVVVGDDDTVMRSQDGHAWSHDHIGCAAHWQSVVHGDGKWIALGFVPNEELVGRWIAVTSNNGRDWTTNAVSLGNDPDYTPHKSSHTRAARALYLNGELYCLVHNGPSDTGCVEPLPGYYDSNGEWHDTEPGGCWPGASHTIVFRSRDAESWSVEEAKGFVECGASGYGMSLFVGDHVEVGGFRGQPLLTSFLPGISGADESVFREVAFGGNRFVAGGPFGAWVSEADAVMIEVANVDHDGTVHLVVFGPAGRHVEIEVSDDLNVWEARVQCVLQDARNEIVVSPENGTARRFWRARLLPL